MKISVNVFAAVTLTIFLNSCAVAPVGSNSGSSGSSSSAMAFIVYVSTNGSDLNSGTSTTSPLRTIQTALSNAEVLGYNTIYVSEGLYTNNDGLNPPVTGGFTNSGVVITNENIRLIGGWDITFTTRSSGHYSVLDGTVDAGIKYLDRLILVMNATNILIDGFLMRNGHAFTPDTSFPKGGGIFFSNVSYSTVTNVVASNNFGWLGGGLALDHSFNNTIHGIFQDNSGGYGGGVFLAYESTNNLVNAEIHNNSIEYEGGGIWLYSTSHVGISGSIYSNVSLHDGGGGIMVKSSSDIIITGANIWGNSGTNGGGISCTNATNVVISNCSLTWNNANRGCGIDMTSTSGTISYCMIRFNTCPDGGSGYGGGIYLINSHPRILNNGILSNYAGAAGGGLFVMNSSPLIADNSILSNFGGSWGDGVYLENSSATNIRNVISAQAYSVGLYNCVPALMIVSNIIGGKIGTGQGIRIFGTTTNYMLRENIFATNILSDLYYNNAGPVQIPVASWANINDTNMTLTEPGSTNNTATNFI